MGLKSIISIIAAASVPFLYSCNSNHNLPQQKIPVERQLLGEIIGQASGINYHLQKINNENSLFAATKKDYAVLDSLKNIGIDSVEVIRKGDISIMNTVYPSYEISK